MSTTTTAKAAPFLSVPLDEQALRNLVAACVKAGVRYGLGSKAPSLNSVPGTGFKRIDCSGFVRWILYKASGKLFTLPDGSVVQHDFIKARNFKRSDTAACELQDGRVRICFLTPKDGGGIGHVLLVLNGLTIESCGGIGPCRREWNTIAHPFMAKMSVYVLEMDEDGAGSN